MEDYAGNAKHVVGKTAKVKPQIQKVIVGDVIVQKKGLGRKIRDLFIEADFRSVLRYVASDVMLPAARNMIVDGATTTVERMMYGESRGGRRGGGYGPSSRITYNNPVSRGYPIDARSRLAPPPTAGPRSRQTRADDIILSSREEAESVLELMNEIVDKYEVASVADLHELVGLPVQHTDNKWGWVFLGDVKPRQVREGYLIDLPPAEPIQ
jgi:hypothetical protein